MNYRVSLAYVKTRSVKTAFRVFEEILRFKVRYSGLAPSYRYLTEAVDRGLTSVKYSLKILEKRGMIQFVYSKEGVALSNYIRIHGESITPSETEMDDIVFLAIREFRTSHAGLSPTYRDIQRLTGIGDRNEAFVRVHDLIDRGVVKVSPMRTRNLYITGDVYHPPEWTVGMVDPS